MPDLFSLRYKQNKAVRRIFLSQENSFHQFPHAYKHTLRLLLYLPLFIDSYNCALYLVDQPHVLCFLASSKDGNVSTLLRVRVPYLL